MCTFTDFVSSQHQNTQAGAWRVNPVAAQDRESQGLPQQQGEAGRQHSAHPTESCFSSVQLKHTHAHLEVVGFKNMELEAIFIPFFTQQTAVLKSILRMRPLCQVAQSLKAFKILKCLHTTSAQGTSRDPHVLLNPQQL